MPQIENAEAILSPSVRAVVLVFSNNPARIELPKNVMDKFYELARGRGTKLILDKTCCEVDSCKSDPHSIFANGDWD